MRTENSEDNGLPVPDYPGQLTVGEHKAYKVAVLLTAEEIRLFNERTKVLASMENQIPEIVKRLAGHKTPFDGGWHLRHILFSSSRGEMVLCSRNLDNKEIFSVIERFDPKSSYAQAHGGLREIIRGNNVHFVLKNLVENEREVLELYRRDIKSTVEKKLTEMFPELDASRVVEAIAVRCGDRTVARGKKEMSFENEKIQLVED